jgi:hypothetical protein
VKVESGVLKLDGDWSALHRIIAEHTGIREPFSYVDFSESQKSLGVVIKHKTPFDAMMNEYKFSRIGNKYTIVLDPFIAKLIACLYGKDVSDEKTAEEEMLCTMIDENQTYKFLFKFAEKNEVTGKIEYGKISFSKEKSLAISETEIFRIVISNFRPVERMRSYKYLSLSLEYPPSVEELTLPYEEEEMHPEYIKFTANWDGKIPEPSEFISGAQIKVPLPVAIHFVEIFARNQCKTEKGFVNKQFFKGGKTYIVDIPFPVPVHVSVTDTAVISCADFMGISKMDLVKQVQFSIKCICTGVQHVAMYQNVIAKNFTQEDVIKKENELGFCFVKDADQKSAKGVSYCMYMIPNEVGIQGKAQVEKFRTFCNDLFHKVALYKCAICGHMSTDNNPCPIGEHIGNRIAFDDGEMSKYSVVCGLRTEQRRYECCGIVNVEFDEGCDKSTNHQFPDDSDDECDIESQYSFQ